MLLHFARKPYFPTTASYVSSGGEGFDSRGQALEEAALDHVWSLWAELGVSGWQRHHTQKNLLAQAAPAAQMNVGAGDRHSDRPIVTLDTSRNCAKIGTHGTDIG